MSKTALSIRIYSYYLFLMGIGMIFIPNILLSIFGFPETTEIWIRVLGTFTFATGIYYFFSSSKEQTEFFKATIWGRTFFFLMCTVFVFALNQNPMLALIGSVDLIGALWTFYTLKLKKL